MITVEENTLLFLNVKAIKVESKLYEFKIKILKNQTLFKCKTKGKRKGIEGINIEQVERSISRN